MSEELEHLIADSKPSNEQIMMSELSRMEPTAPQPSATEFYEDILARQMQMQGTLDAILAKFDSIASEIKPLIDTVSTHPLIKMLGKGKS